MRSVILLLLLSACAAPGATSRPVRPAEVVLYRDTVTAEMSDGTLCTAVREAQGGPWQASFRGCPHPWPVSVLRPATRPRVPLSPVSENAWVRIVAPEATISYGPRR